MRKELGKGQKISWCISFLELPECILYTGWLKTTKIYCFTVLEARSLRLRCQVGWFLFRALRENLFQASHPADDFWSSLVSTTSYQSLLHLHVPSHCVCVCVQISSFFFFLNKDSSHIRLGAFPIPIRPHFNICSVTSAMTLFSKKLTFIASRG